MKLGIISTVNETGFEFAKEQGLDFVEFCINGGYDMEGFFRQTRDIKKWIDNYKVDVGSIGRWKTQILDNNGEIDQKELCLAYKLIDTASLLDCPNYVCGCNYIETLSCYENVNRAIEFFFMLIDYGKEKNVRISTYNCRKMNFVYNPMAWTIIHGHLKDLGIKYDTANSIYDGGDYLKEASDWGHRFNHVHLKGSLAAGSQRVDDPPAGLDQTDWKSFLSILHARKYDGGLSIEPHSSNWQGDMYSKGVSYTVKYMKSLLQHF